jgi:hypothetical protein
LQHLRDCGQRRSVGQEALELLQIGRIAFSTPYPTEILAIKRGERPPDRDLIDELGAYRTSVLKVEVGQMNTFIKPALRASTRRS